MVALLVLIAAEQEKGFLTGREDWRDAKEKPFEAKRLVFNGVLLEERENRWWLVKTLEVEEEDTAAPTSMNSELQKPRN